MELANTLAALAFVTAVGLATGLVTGLSPGLHVNNVAAFLLAAQGAWIALLGLVSPQWGSDPRMAGILLSCFLIATSSSHAVFNFVPSVFLGAPTEDTAVATLPGHRLLLAGQGAKAVALAARGAVLGTAFSIVALLPLRGVLADPVYLAARFHPWAPVFLVGVLLALLGAEARGSNRLRRVACGLFVQGLAGLLGIATLRGPTAIDPALILFPLFSGLFGIPNLLIGLGTPPGAIPPQRVEPLRAVSRGDVRGAVRGTLAGAAISWLPGLSGGAAATLAAAGTRRRVGPNEFMVVLGAVSASTGLLSVSVLYMIQRSRSGAAAAIRDLLGDPVPWKDLGAIPGSLVLLIGSALGATAVAAPIATRLARCLAGRWSRSNPRRFAAASLAAILAMLFFTTGLPGVAVAACATLLGFVPIQLRVRRVHLMASLLVPVLVSYLIPAS